MTFLKKEILEGQQKSVASDVYFRDLRHSLDQNRLFFNGCARVVRG